MADLSEVKRALGTAAVDRFVRDGMRIGLGTGSTAVWATRRVGELLAGGRLNGVRALATSLQTDLEARGLGIPLVTLNDAGMEDGPDLTIDGADEVDPNRNLIKGGGGAMLLEKLLAYASQRFLVIVDDSKLSSRLGERFAVPVEVVRFGWRATWAALERTGATITMRTKAGQPYLTDEGHYILDCAYPGIADARQLEAALNAIPGVVDSGLFTGMVEKVVVAGASGVYVLERPPARSDA